MWHLLKYHFLILIRNKALIFWVLIFPILLSTFLQMTVANAYQPTELDTISLAVINDEAYQEDQAFQRILKEVKIQEKALFEVHEYELEQAKQALKDGQIVAYVEVQDVYVAHVNSSGLSQTIVTTFLNEYTQQRLMMETLIAQGVDPQQLMDQMGDTTSYIQAQEDNGNIACIYFYTVLAMTSLYGGYWIMRSSSMQMADQSECGKRNAIAPTHRALQLFADFLLTILMNFVVQIVMVFYMIVILQIDFGSDIWPVLLVLLIGTFAGNALGLLVSMYGKKNYEVNTGILTAVTLIACMLSGMMFVQMKFYVQEYAPWLARINPANMITDALYANYYYGVDDRFYQNILALLIFTLIAYLLGYLRLRRKQYDSL